MFEQIKTLLDSCKSVSIIATANGEKLTLTVMPNPKAAGDVASALATPLQITGTPDELDAGLGNALTQYVGAHKSLAEQVEATMAVMDAAKKAASEKAAAAVTKAKASPVKVATSKTLPPPVAGEDNGDEEDERGDGEIGAAHAALVTPVSDDADLFA